MPSSIRSWSSAQQRRPQVVELALQLVEPRPSLDAGQHRRRPFGQVQEPGRVALHGLVVLFGRQQPLVGVLPDHLQHVVPRLAPWIAVPPDEALVEQGGGEVEGVMAKLPRSRDGPGGIERPAAAERGEAAEECLLPGCEQVVTPGDRRPERVVPLRDVASARVAAPCSAQASGSTAPGHLGARRSSQRQPIQALADPNDITEGWPIGLERGVHRPGALGEQLHRFDVGRARVVRVARDSEGRHLELPFAGQMDRLPAGHEHVQVGCASEPLGDDGGTAQQVLEVVEDQQQPA
jgi:hypothetical protein